MSFIGCVSTNVTKLGNSAKRAPISVKDVVIYRNAEQVHGEYEEVALLNSVGDSSWTNENQMYESMKRKAASMGANAIILDATSEPSAGSKIAATLLWGGGAERKGRAIGIYIYPEGSKHKKINSKK